MHLPEVSLIVRVQVFKLRQDVLLQNAEAGLGEMATDREAAC